MSHHRDKKGTMCRYSVWSNLTDEVYAIDCTAAEAATAIGVKVKTFYRYVCRGCRLWHIEKRFIDQEDDL